MVKEIMRVKLMYHARRELWFTAAALPKYIDLEKAPEKGQLLGCKNGIVAEVTGINETPGSEFQDVIVVVQLVKAAA